MWHLNLVWHLYGLDAAWWKLDLTSLSNMNNPFLKYLPLPFKEPRSNVKCAGHRRITWGYTPEHLGMANATAHPANLGIVNGVPGNGDAQEEDLIALKLSQTQDLHLLPIKEDISEWITRTTGVDITPETFLHVLDSGIVLCRLSRLIEKKARECERLGKLTEPLPDFKLRCNERAKSGTWFARDNVTNFLGWCRAYGMPDETMFDSEDLVAQREEKPIIYCLMELARIGWRYGLEPPNLIRMEKEIEKEEKFEPPPFTPKPIEIITQPVKPVEIKPKLEKVDLHKEVKRIAQLCKCQDYVNRISEGVYDVFGKRVFIRLLHGKHLMVRVGGGWDTFENYLLHHDPIQVYEFRRSATRESLNSGFDGYLVIKSKYKS